MGVSFSTEPEPEKDEELEKYIPQADIYSVVGKAPAWPSGLMRHGIASMPVSAELLKPLQDVFWKLEEDRISGFKGLFAERLGCYESNEVFASPYYFGVSYADNSAVANDMTWIWAKDANTLELFRPLYDAAVKHGLTVGGKEAKAPLKFWNASYIVHRGGFAKRGSTTFHEDFGEKVPPGVAFTLLTPLFELPADAGGLEFYPWHKAYTPEGSEAAEKAACLKYSVGEMVVFDGRLAHRTEPYDLGEDGKDFVRVLVSLFAYPDAPREITGACRAAMYGQHEGDAYTSPSQWHFKDGSDDEDESSDSGSGSGEE